MGSIGSVRDIKYKDHKGPISLRDLVKGLSGSKLIQQSETVAPPKLPDPLPPPVPSPPKPGSRCSKCGTDAIAFMAENCIALFQFQVVEESVWKFCNSCNAVYHLKLRAWKLYSE